MMDTFCAIGSASQWRSWFYRGHGLATEISESGSCSVIASEGVLLAQADRGVQSRITLMAVDEAQSVLLGQAARSCAPVNYLPYGFSLRRLSLLLGFNGEPRDRQLDCYFLGAGYRAFNPVLMRFNSPDSWSPFGDGGMNAYAYALGDPVNRSDPTGHMPRKHTPKLPKLPKKAHNEGAEALAVPGSSSEPSVRSRQSKGKKHGLPEINEAWVESQVESFKPDLNDDGWSVDTSGAVFNSRDFTTTEMNNYTIFHRSIARYGAHPKTVAEKIGDSKYTSLVKRLKEFEIRLSGASRVTFTLEGKVVRIRNVGGHS